MIIRKDAPDSAKKTADTLRNNGIVIVPTDTIYGFSGIVPASRERIIAAKGRDEGKPFIELIARSEDIARFTDAKINPKLLAFWPGAVTIIVNNRSGGTTAFRCPGDAWLREVIALTGSPIYSTSVNKSGESALRTIGDITRIFGNIADLIVDAGDCEQGMASTLINATEDSYRVIRQGSVVIPSECLTGRY
jgi:L-threonylcarbamoyladenylate synthase